MKTIKLFVLCLLLIPTFGVSQTYNVPWAQQQPAWVFPIWFEDSTGARDTLYFNYDPSADTIFNQIRDTVFGDFKVPFDTSRFQVYEDCVLPDDLLVYKSATYSASTIYYGMNLCFFKVVLPVTVSWDVNLLRSSALPFPDQSPAPRAQGEYQPSSLEPVSATQECYMTEPVLMTDSFLVPASCHFADSFVLDGTFAMPMSFQVLPWTGAHTAVEEVTPFAPWTVGLHSKDVITITSKSHSAYRVAVYDVTGRCIHTSIGFNKLHQLDASGWTDGLYLITLTDKSYLYTYKVAKH